MAKLKLYLKHFGCRDFKAVTLEMCKNLNTGHFLNHIPGTANTGLQSHGVMSGECAGTSPKYKALRCKVKAQNSNRLQFHSVRFTREYLETAAFKIIQLIYANCLSHSAYT